MPENSTSNPSLSADMRVCNAPFATMWSPGQGINRYAPPGLCTSTCTQTASPMIHRSWSNEDSLLVPSLVFENFKVSPHHIFRPVSRHQSETDSLVQVRDQGQDVLQTPPTSPFEQKKLSPTLTAQTVSISDSYESFRSNASTPDGNDSNKSFSCLPQGRNPTDKKKLSSLQRALWVPPRSIDVCRIVNASDRDSPSSVAGLSRSYSYDSCQSPYGRAKTVLSQPRVEHDPIRKSRIKTEMCLHYINKTACPFGASCTYAHGQEELQLTRLMDLHEAGLVDASTYRVVPCLTFVATGSCPFGKRCHGIHDPRVAGNVQSWLPHTETQGNTIATDINVDALHQKRLYSLLHNNPFGALFNTDETSFEELYNVVCNNFSQSSCKKQKKGITYLEDHHKLSIALQMRGGPNFQFKFRPQHIVYDELCMVLQKRAFRLTNKDAVEIPFNTYNFRSPKDVLVRELAFGPDCDPTVRGVGLWFEISESDVTVCTPQQAKRFRWKRGVNNKKHCQEESKGPKTKDVKFESQDCFSMIRPSEGDAYDLATRMLRHRLAILRVMDIMNLCERVLVIEDLNTEYHAIQTCFAGLFQAWKNWTWPVNEGRDKVDENSTVPSVEACYKPIGNNPRHSLTTVHAVWESFASVGLMFAHEKFEEKRTDIAPSTTRASDNKDLRLSVFKRLAEGMPLHGARHKSMPHISDSDDGFEVTGFHALQSRRCWKSLLLKPSSFNEYNEWGLVSDHFQNSRSRKVLSILQSQ